MQEENKEVLKEKYDLVYTRSSMAQSSTNEKLELIWEQFNQDHPIDYHSPSLSVSDIVALKQNGVVTCHYCDSFGFTELSVFFPRQSVKKRGDGSGGRLWHDRRHHQQRPEAAHGGGTGGPGKAGEQISLLDLANAVQRNGETRKSPWWNG